MKILTMLTLLLVSPLDTRAQNEIAGRFQIITGAEGTIKLDTMTGQSWILQTLTIPNPGSPDGYNVTGWVVLPDNLIAFSETASRALQNRKQENILDSNIIQNSILQTKDKKVRK